MSICVAGCLEVEDGLLKVQVDPAGALECGPAGLRAVSSPDGCNCIQVRPNGLFGICPDAVVGFADQVSPQFSLLPVAVSNPPGPPDPTNFDFDNSNSPTSIHICNTTGCNLTGFIEMSVGGLEIDTNVGFLGNCHLQIKVNSGAFVDVIPLSEQVVQNVGDASLPNGGVQRFSFNGMHAEYTPTLAVGECVDIQWRQTLSCNSGTGTLFSIGSGPRFITRWMFVQTGCC